MFRLIGLIILYRLHGSVGFLSTPQKSLRYTAFRRNIRFAKKQSQTIEIEDETPAGVVGAEFFGGNKQKDELYVQSEEDSAAVSTDAVFNRFFADDSIPSSLFDSPLCAKVALDIQNQINAALYENTEVSNFEYSFATNLMWESPMKKQSSTPLDELEESLDFYKNIDLAIISGSQINENTLEFQWSLSVVWPALWAPRVLLVGSSVCQLDGNKRIVKQTDKLIDDADLLSVVSSQIKPRFWDLYHIGMTPSAECTPKLRLKKRFGYQIYEIPPRLVTSPSMVETGTREDCNAEALPNHTFSCIIKTMGPKRQLYVPTTPVEVQIIPGDQLKFKWTIPLAVEFLTNTKLTLAGSDEETDERCDPQCRYEFHERRKVATTNYGGSPQDSEVSSIRKQLYEKIIGDGLKPKLDENGRPIFFFLQNEAKACYTSEGLGMCVYEWRLKASKPDEIGIELEFS